MSEEWDDEAMKRAFDEQMSIYAQFAQIKEHKEAVLLAAKLDQEDGIVAQEDQEEDEEDEECDQEEDDYEEQEEEQEEQESVPPPLGMFDAESILHKMRSRLPLPTSSSSEDDGLLSELLMSWYYAGYCTARYKYQRKKK
jgi:hypothetical protein